MNICFFGGYDPAYPRNAVLRRGLELAGACVLECRKSSSQKFWFRYPRLFGRYAFGLRKERRALGGIRPILFVPEFCHKDMPAAKIVARLTGGKIVFDPLASRYETKIVDRRIKPENSALARWNRMIDRRSLELADLVLADTAAHKSYYCEEFGVPPGKVEVLPIGFDDRQWKEAPPAGAAPPRPFTIVFFGSFLPLHGADVIVEAARIVAARDPSIEFRIIGGGQTFPAVRRIAVDSNLSNVRFEGWVPYEELARRVASEADLCLGIFGRTAKARRVVPHKVFQAMAAGKPVVTLRTPAAEEFFLHGENVFFCDGPDPGLLAGSILTMKNDAGLRSSIARRGCDLVREKFNPRALGVRLIGFLEKHLGTDGERGAA